ncbi:hypothetical protein Tco_0933589 [Tanacetum coccineum]
MQIQLPYFNIDFSAYIINGLKITNLTQETLLGPAFKLFRGTRNNFAELEYDFEECYKALSEKLDWDNPEGGDYPFDLTKPLPLVMNGNRQIVPVDYFFNNDLKYLQGGISTMTYTTSITKTKAAQYDLPGIEDMVPNIWSPVKVAYDKHAKWGISHWREQRKTFYGYARGLESSHDVYSTKRILAVTRVEVMRKHGYGYLREIEVRRADNELYTFKEGDFPRLRINDIEDMLLLVVQNRLTNLSGNDVSDFAIALRMFTRSMVIQKRVEDLQLGVESYQKKINITKPETTRPGIRKRDPYTPYQDPQGFIYVDNQGRNRLMRSDELYKFSDGTLFEAEEQGDRPVVGGLGGERRVVDGSRHTTSDDSGALTEHLRVIEDLSTRLGNLENGHGKLVKKVIHVSDAEVTAGIYIGEIGLKVFAVERQGQQTATQRDEVIDGLTQQVQALQGAVQQRDSQI